MPWSRASGRTIAIRSPGRPRHSGPVGGREPQILWVSTAFDVDDGRAKRPRPEVSSVRRGRAAPGPPGQDRREGRDRLLGGGSGFEMRGPLPPGPARAETDFRAFCWVFAPLLPEDPPPVAPDR